MNAIAEFSTARQLLAINGLIPPVTAPRIGAGRVHLIAKPDDNATQRVVSVSELVAALSKTEWRDTMYLADRLEVTTQTVVDRMARAEMVALTEWRRVGRGGRYEWRLK